MNPQQIFIFTGPTISPDIAQQHLDAVYLPPVKLGDVYRISELFEPRFIGIIDGYFNQVPAVWHKEILQAISQGIRLFGASSMGALRAAELDQLGMTGCGEIYQAYKSGVLPPFTDEAFEDEDEVAVIHAPAELGYLTASDAMVNIRFTLAKAKQHRIIDQSTCRQLAKIAKKLFYADRSYTRILDIARQEELPENQLKSFSEWIVQHSVNQKQLDAICLLEQIKRCSSRPPIPSTVESFAFETTSQWQSAIEEIGQSQHIENNALNELRLKGPEYFEVLERAIHSPSSPQKGQACLNPQHLTQYHNSPEKLNQLFSTYWHQNHDEPSGETLSPMQQDQRLLKFLKQHDELKPLEAKAKLKFETLSRLKTKPHSAVLNDLDRLQLCDWYFSTQLDMEMPNQIETYTQRLGFSDTESFYDMILGEYLYRTAN